MPNRNNERGKTAERRIAKLWTDIIGWKFARTPGSGSGHAWGFFANDRVRGDIVCVEKGVTFPFLVESKKVKDFPWDLMFTNRPPADFVKWWAKAKQDATLDGKFVALVISRNQGPMVMVTAAVAWAALGMNIEYASVRLKHKNKSLVICDAENFAHAFKTRRNK